MKRHYHSYKAFIDLFMNMLAGFAMLLVVTFILVNPKAKDDKSKDPKAEIVITVVWPKGLNDDVDTYVEDPAGHLVYFQRREDGLMHLDRDDQGRITDRVEVEPGVWVDYKENQEIVTIRGLVPGEYVVNIHMYRKRDAKPTSVDVTLEKINPRLKLIAAKTLVLTKNGDEKTVFRFTVTKEGEITNISYLAKKIAHKHVSPDRFDYSDPDLDEYDPYNDEDYYEEYNNEEYNEDIPENELDLPSLEGDD